MKSALNNTNCRECGGCPACVTGRIQQCNGAALYIVSANTLFGVMEFSFTENTDVAVYLKSELVGSLSRPALRFGFFRTEQRRLSQLRRLARRHADSMALDHAIDALVHREDLATPLIAQIQGAKL